MNMVRLAIGCALAVGFTATGARADFFTAASGNLSASADFATSGQDLVITLTNTSLADVLAPADVLTALFFDIYGDPDLTRVSAVLGTGSSVKYDPQGQPAGGVVGGEWAYTSGLFGAPFSANYGISSSGFDLFGPPDRFVGPNLAGPPNPAGLEYGILSAGDNDSTGNGGVLGSGGLIKNSVIFKLSGYSGERISNVSFQYGTDLNGPNVSVPDGGMTLMLLGGVLIGLETLRRRFSA